MGNMTTKEILQGIKGWADDKFAAKDGYYEQMSVGVAKNLEGTDDTSGSFIERTSGGDAEISTGQALLTGIEGNANQWNQWFPLLTSSNAGSANSSVTTVSIDANGVITCTTVNANAGYGYERAFYTNVLNGATKKPIIGHVYCLCVDIKTPNNYEFYCDNSLLGGANIDIKGLTSASYNIWKRCGAVRDCKSSNNPNGTFYMSLNGKPSAGTVIQYKNVQLYDLTLMFGSNAEIASKLGITEAQVTNNDGTAFEAFQKWVTDNIGFTGFHPKDLGSLLSVKMNKLTSIGYNLLDPTTHKAHLIGDYDDTYDNKYGIVGTYSSIQFTDVYGNISNPTVASDGSFSVDGKEGDLLVNGAGDDCAVFMWYDGTKTEYEPYQKESRDIDVTGITGINPNTGTRETIFPDGLKGIGNIKDFLGLNENGETIAIKKIGKYIFTGEEPWSAGYGVLHLYHGALYAVKTVPYGSISAIVSNLYPSKPNNYNYVNADSGYINELADGSQYIIVGEYANYSTASSWKSHLQSIYSSGNPLILYYIAETEVTYTDLQDASGNAIEFPLTFWSDNWGTETIEPLNDSTGTTMIAPTISAQYSMDAVEAIKTLQDTVEEIQDTLDTKADIDGVYKDMVVGTAQNLEGNQIVSEPFMFRTAGGDIDFTDGNAQALEIKGDSVAVNQLVQNGDFSDGTTNWNTNGASISVSNGELLFTRTGNYSRIIQQRNIPANHKVYMALTAKSSAIPAFSMFIYGESFSSVMFALTSSYKRYSAILSYNGDVNEIQPFRTSEGNIGDTAYIKDVVLLDLTQMGIDNLTTPAQVEEWLASHVGLKSYYPYNTGSLLNSKLSALESVGFNQFDESTLQMNKYRDPSGVESIVDGRRRSDVYFPCLPNTEYYFYTSENYVWNVVVCWYDSEKNYISGDSVGGTYRTSPSNAAYFRISNADAPTCHIAVILSWDRTRNGEYEPYQKNSLSLPVTTLTGINPNTGERETIFPNGMRGAGSIKDRIYIEGGVVKAAVNVGSVDLGSLTELVGHSTVANVFVTSELPRKYGSTPLLLCGKYTRVYAVTSDMEDKSYGGYQSSTGIYFKDTSCANASAFKTANSGVMLNYELATPIIYTDIQLEDGTPFTLPKSIQVSNWGTEMIQPQNPSDGTALNTCAPVIDLKYAIDAVEAIDTLQNDGIMYTDLKNNFSSFLTALNQALNGIGTISISQNPTDKTYAFTFTASQS